MSFSEDCPNLKPGDTMEIPDHATNTAELWDSLYLLQLSRATGITDSRELDRMYTQGRVPNEIDKSIRGELAARTAFKFKYTGKFKMPFGKAGDNSVLFGVQDYLAQATIGQCIVETVNPEQVGARHAYIGTDRESRAFSGAASGVYGSAGRNFTYFTQDWKLALSHAGEKPVLLEIDLEKLAQKRSIFPDPEAKHIPAERGRTFVVMGGVPLDAIVSAYNFERVA